KKMLAILLTCLVIGSATGCSLPQPLNKTLDIEDAMGVWYIQYMRPNIPLESTILQCWRNVINKTDDGYQMTSSVYVNFIGIRFNLPITNGLEIKPGTGNQLISSVFGISSESTVVALLPDKYVIIGACIFGIPFYSIASRDVSPDTAEISDLVQSVGLQISDLTKNCDDPNHFNG
ncbi:hypothetical protein L9F63_003851, partial [Diploptera punctata]